MIIEDIADCIWFVGLYQTNGFDAITLRDVDTTIGNTIRAHFDKTWTYALQGPRDVADTMSNVFMHTTRERQEIFIHYIKEYEHDSNVMSMFDLESFDHMRTPSPGQLASACRAETGCRLLRSLLSTHPFEYCTNVHINEWYRIRYKCDRLLMAYEELIRHKHITK